MPGLTIEAIPVRIRDPQGPNSGSTDAVGAEPVPDHQPRTEPEGNDRPLNIKQLALLFQRSLGSVHFHAD
jgi:hypothetical protein